jgi:hypothetical protein
VTLGYDADELLYYCYVRSLAQSVLNSTFRAHWADTGKQGAGGAGNAGFDRRPPPLTLTRRECDYIAKTIFIRNQGEEVEHEKQMFNDFMGSVDAALENAEIDSSDFMKIAVERYFATRPAGEGEAERSLDMGEAQPPIAPTAAEEAAAAAVEPDDSEPFEFDHPLMTAVFSGESVETAEANYIDELLASAAFANLPAEVAEEVSNDLAGELSQRLLDAEGQAANAKSEREFQMTIAEAIQSFDAMAKLVAEHVQTMNINNSFKGGEGGGGK